MDQLLTNCYDPLGGIAIDFPYALIMQQRGQTFEFYNLMLSEVIPSSAIRYQKG